MLDQVRLKPPDERRRHRRFIAGRNRVTGDDLDHRSLPACRHGQERRAGEASHRERAALQADPPAEEVGVHVRAACTVGDREHEPIPSEGVEGALGSERATALTDIDRPDPGPMHHAAMKQSQPRTRNPLE
jgi:hypothetical protein